MNKFEINDGCSTFTVEKEDGDSVITVEMLGENYQFTFLTQNDLKELIEVLQTMVE